LESQVLVAAHADLLQRRDERAGLDRHAAEGERPDIAAAAELFWRIVPALLVRVPRDRSIEPGEGPLGRPSRERDHVGTVREHLAHSVEGGDGVVRDEGQRYRVPDLADL